MPLEVAVAIGAEEIGGAVAADALASGLGAETIGGIGGGLADGFGEGAIGELGAGLTDGYLSSAASNAPLTSEALNGAVTGSAEAGAGGTTSIAAESVPSDISTAAKNLVGVDSPPVAEVGAGRGIGPEGPLIGDSGAVDTFASGANKKGLIDTAMDWAKDNPRLAAGALQGAGSALGGVAKGAGQVLTEQRRLQNEKELAAARLKIYRDFVQSGSQGGVGVNLGVKPTGGLLNLPA